VSESESDTPILIAYDGSDCSKEAIFEAGRQLPRGRAAVVLTVSEPIEGIPFLGASGVPIEAETMEEILAAANEGAQKVAEEGAGLAREGGFEAEPMVRSGSPVWRQIVAAAEERDASLIAIGSHGRSGLAYLALGSVAASVAQHSKRSVLIVHSRD
jgi:nucleotide-binding universal stress UspA family protein